MIKLITIRLIALKGIATLCSKGKMSNIRRIWSNMKRDKICHLRFMLTRDDI